MDRQKKDPVGEKRKRSRLTGRQKALTVIAILLAVLVLIVAACQSLFVRPDLPGKKDPNKSGSQEGEAFIDYGDGTRPKADGARKSQDFYTVLLLGRDTGGGGNTDTMLLASYDVTNQKATVMSIPRDTMVNVPWDVKKINSVYGYYGGGDKGIKALYREIAQLVGFEPDYQVVVEWEAVGKIVEAIGGVYFDVPYEMDYHDPHQDLVIEQAKGYRLLNGDDAMQVIRWRANDNDSPYGHTKKQGGIGDSGRMKVQQDFLKAVIKQMLRPENILKIGSISKVFQENVETDLSFREILWFGKQAVTGGLNVEDVEFLTMPFKGASAWSRSYQQPLSYVVPIAKDLLDIVNTKLSPFVEPSVMSDLDIMSVNSDGSLSSTTGRVEDAQAAKPPVKPEKPDPSAPMVDENGNLVDADGNILDPETGEILVPTPDTPPIQPGGAVEPDPPDLPGTSIPEVPVITPPDAGEEAPVFPTDPEVPVDFPDIPSDEGNNSIIEPPPAV